jgi:hypothetical protein
MTTNCPTKDILVREEFNGIDSLKSDDDFPSSEYFHGRSNDIGEDGSLFSSDFNIPLINKIINEYDDGPRNEDHVHNHSTATNQGDSLSLVRSPDNVFLDIPSSDNEISSSEDDAIVETLQRSIVSRTRNIDFYINLNHSSSTRSMKEFLTKSISISDMISSECCQKNCLKRMDYMYALNKRKTYLSMKKSMQNPCLMGRMISTKIGYDCHIQNL